MRFNSGFKGLICSKIRIEFSLGLQSILCKYDIIKTKGKGIAIFVQSCYRAREFQEAEGPRFRNKRLMKVGRLSAPHRGHFYFQEIYFRVIKISNDNIGIGTCKSPTCSRVSQPTALLAYPDIQQLRVISLFGSQFPFTQSPFCRNPILIHGCKELSSSSLLFILHPWNLQKFLQVIYLTWIVLNFYPFSIEF